MTVTVWLFVDETFPILLIVLVYSITQKVFCISKLLCSYRLGVVSIIGSNKNFGLISLINSWYYWGFLPLGI